MFIEHRAILKVLSQHHAKEMRGKAGASVMCVCGAGCGGTQACGEMKGLIAYVEKLEAKVEALENPNPQ